MDQIVYLLTQDWVIYIFVSFIGIVALIPFYQAIFTIKSVNKDLDNVTSVLRALGDKPRHENFYGQFEMINQKISNIKEFKHAWSEFIESMYLEKHETNKKCIFLIDRLTILTGIQFWGHD